MTNTLQQVRELIEKKMEILKKELDIAGDQKWGQTFLVNESKIHAFQELLSDLNSLLLDDSRFLFAGKSNKVKRFNFIKGKLAEGLSWAEIGRLTGRERTVEFNFYKLNKELNSLPSDVEQVINLINKSALRESEITVFDLKPLYSQEGVDLGER